jgi:NADH-quinone oxidoreductase subunit E
MATLTQPRSDASGLAFLDQVIAENQGRPGALLTVLERAQEHNPQHYLPTETLQYVAGRMRIPPARIFSVVTFYALFNLEPQGKNTICVCRGTACHTRGSRNLLNGLRLDLGVPATETNGDADKTVFTTPDRKFTIRTVACFGQCALAPVVEINHRICSHVNERSLQRELRALARESE